ncbi:putative Restriction endonuclease [Vibrio metschnikovii]|uniref:HNH endonuclease n=1 Tax=Vibrio metschnikovii TaxID=28172 RepID=UPI0001B95372|nr:hypothetical protein [Vibrio metschnikovii]EEX36508.1 HNH nuclease [Vibrio metschnikovii CIP 69.14]SUP49822.1 putative Restriction endonuclease [Vibrio metschnikovii]SUQ10236.1 putative Restriction endonuclease [Vibrio metschnikovii]
MFTICKPTLDADEIFDACIKGIQNNENRVRLSNSKSYIRACYKVYKIHAGYSLLYKLNDEYEATGKLLKDELVKLYEQQLVKNKAGRVKYDLLLSLAPNGICPFCGFSQATTLDHYMPKKKYPSFSIIPINLVPACSDCNRGKNEGVATDQKSQVIHPYFDHKLFNEQWLYASVKQTSPASVTFYVSPPDNWHQIDKDRVKAHFDDFKLATRFSVQVATELAPLKYELKKVYDISSKVGVRDFLNSKKDASACVHLNWWRTAMYQALASSDWYCNGGFQ